MTEPLMLTPPSFNAVIEPHPEERQPPPIERQRGLHVQHSPTSVIPTIHESTSKECHMTEDTTNNKYQPIELLQALGMSCAIGALIGVTICYAFSRRPVTT